MSKMDSIMEKTLPVFSKFANSKIICALKDGVMLTVPLTLVGSLFLLIRFFPISGWDSFMANIFGKDWGIPLTQVSGATMDIISLVSVFGIAYYFTKNEGIEEAVPSGLLAIVSFIIVTVSSTKTEGGEIVSGIIPKNWTGGKGMIAAILIGLAVGYIYSFLINHKIAIKMPPEVPKGVANAFTALIPAFVIATLSVLVFILFKVTTGKTFIEWVFAVIQVPIQGLTDSWGGIIIIPILMTSLFFFGIHGPAIVGAVMQPIYLSNALQNQDVISAGGKLVAGDNAAILTQQFIDNFVNLSGNGITIGLVIAMLFIAKSSQLRKLGKLSIVPAIFNINEPVIFGFPIMLNPIMLIPFILVPTLASIITYGAISIGFMPPFTGVMAPWTTPPIISGFIVSGWQGAIVQGIIILLSVVIYYPFLKIQDRQYQIDEGKIKNN